MPVVRRHVRTRQSAPPRSMPARGKSPHGLRLPALKRVQTRCTRQGNSEGEDGRAGGELLPNKAGDRDHGKPPVVELLLLHGLVLELQGVEAKVAGLVAGAEDAHRLRLRLLVGEVGLDPATARPGASKRGGEAGMERATRRRPRERGSSPARALDLDKRDASDEKGGVLLGDAAQLVDGERVEGHVRLEGVAKDLLHEEADGREHRHATVRQLGLAPEEGRSAALPADTRRDTRKMGGERASSKREVGRGWRRTGPDRGDRRSRRGPCLAA